MVGIEMGRIEMVRIEIVRIEMVTIEMATVEIDKINLEDCCVTPPNFHTLYTPPTISTRVINFTFLFRSLSSTHQDF